MKKLFALITAAALLLALSTNAFAELSLDYVVSQYNAMGTEHISSKCTYDKENNVIQLRMEISDLNFVSYKSSPELQEGYVEMFVQIRDGFHKAVLLEGGTNTTCVFVISASGGLPVYVDINGTDVGWMFD